jgi:putative tricarboxylic transport membrane protein
MEQLVLILHNMWLGCGQLATLSGFSAILGGTLFGIVVGAIPGLSPAMGVALLIPFTYSMTPSHAFILFVAAYQAANYGGSITAIAINAPGTPSSAVTAIDGYELTKRGQSGAALSTSLYASVVGGFIGAIILLLVALPLASIALMFGPAEYCCLAFLGLTTVVSFGKGNYLKSLSSLFLGLLLSCVGLDPFSGTARFTFGQISLFDGISLVPAMIGLFALSEVFRSDLREQLPFELEEEEGTTLVPVASLPLRPVLRSSIIGTFIGIIPGAGATIASFISYAVAKNRSTKSEEFGSGSLEGIAASEAANSSSVGGALVPLLALGIPGSATDAVLLGALTLHGLVAGPELFVSQPTVVYGMLSAVLISNIFILLLGLLGNKLWIQIVKIPSEILNALIISMSILGSYTVSNSTSDCWTCFLFGVLGWVLKSNKYPLAPVVLGLVLGQMIELNLRRAHLMGGWSIFVQSPLCIVLLLSSLAALLQVMIHRSRSEKS